MTKLLLVLLLAFSTLTMAFAEDLSKDQILNVMQELKSTGMIPADKAPEIEKMIKDMSPAELAKVQGLARGVASKTPEAQSDSGGDAKNSIDMNSKEFQAGEEEIKKMLK